MYVFMEFWRKLSYNYHQILLHSNSSGVCYFCYRLYLVDTNCNLLSTHKSGVLEKKLCEKMYLMISVASEDSKQLACLHSVIVWWVCHE